MLSFCFADDAQSLAKKVDSVVKGFFTKAIDIYRQFHKRNLASKETILVVIPLALLRCRLTYDIVTIKVEVTWCQY